LELKQEEFERQLRAPKGRICSAAATTKEFERHRQLQAAEFELDQLELCLSQKQQERSFQHKLFKSLLRAVLEETNAEIAVQSVGKALNPLIASSSAQSDDKALNPLIASSLVQSYDKALNPSSLAQPSSSTQAQGFEFINCFICGSER